MVLVGGQKLDTKDVQGEPRIARVSQAKHIIKKEAKPKDEAPKTKEEKIAEAKDPEKKLAQVDKQLEQIESKTEKMLAEAKKIEAQKKQKEDDLNKAVETEDKKTNPAKQQNKKRKKYEMKKKASYIYFLMAKGLPGKILNHIAKKAKYKNNHWFCILETGELEALLVGNEGNEQGNEQTLVNSCIYRLQKQGWFLKKISDNGGGRTVIIDPTLYGLDESNNIQ